MVIVKTILKTVLLLLLPFLIVCSTEEEAKEETTEQNTASPNKDKEDRCKNRTERQVSCSNKTKEEPEEHTYTFRFKPTASTHPGCWPKKNIQTTLTKPDDSHWSAFLPRIFDMSREWNDLTDYWNKGRKKSIKKLRKLKGKSKQQWLGFYSYPRPHCIRKEKSIRKEKTGATGIDDIFIDFHIKSRQSLPEPIRVSSKYWGGAKVEAEERAYYESNRRVWPSDHLIRSRSELEALWGPSTRSSGRNILYEIDFSKKKLLFLSVGFFGSGCGFTSIYDNLVAVYEWNGKLYIIKKGTTWETSYSYGTCFRYFGFVSSLLILDHAKDLPVEWIKIP